MNEAEYVLFVTRRDDWAVLSEALDALQDQSLTPERRTRLVQTVIRQQARLFPAWSNLVRCGYVVQPN